MSEPHDPIAAVTHPNPYPYYARLVREQAFAHDSDLGLWVAASAEAVSAVLTSDLCRVRPPAEPVPAPIAGTAAGDVFNRLVRMNDGDDHCTLKPAVSATLAALDMGQVAVDAGKWARELLAGRDHSPPFAFALPVYVLGTQLGIPDHKLPQTASWMDDFVRCLSPLSSPQQIEQSIQAAGQLHNQFITLLEDGSDQTEETLLGKLATEIRRAGCDDPSTIAANGIGFLSQAYEATAGLIGNTALALASRPDLREKARSDPALLRQAVAETVRHNAPIQNTRRFVVSDGEIAGHRVRSGEAILIILAAANHDPAVYSHPEQFDPARGTIQSFTFGEGPHACPGSNPATVIAAAAMEQLLERGVFPEGVADVEHYPSVNARIPILPGLTAPIRD